MVDEVASSQTGGVGEYIRLGTFVQVVVVAVVFEEVDDGSENKKIIIRPTMFMQSKMGGGGL